MLSHNVFRILFLHLRRCLRFGASLTPMQILKQDFKCFLFHVSSTHSKSFTPPELCIILFKLTLISPRFYFSSVRLLDGLNPPFQKRKFQTIFFSQILSPPTPTDFRHLSLTDIKGSTYDSLFLEVAAQEAAGRVS